MDRKAQDDEVSRKMFEIEKLKREVERPLCPGERYAFKEGESRTLRALDKPESWWKAKAEKEMADDGHSQSLRKKGRETMNDDNRGENTRAYYPGELEALKREAEAEERKMFREQADQIFPRTLYEWELQAGPGYFCRIVETQPGIVHFEEAPHPLDPSLELFWMRTDKPKGCANEMIQLAQFLEEAEDENEDWRQSAQRAALDTCGDEKHCSCVGPLRREVRELDAAKSLNARIAADAIANRERDERRHQIEMENERHRFAAHLSEVDARAEKAERELAEARELIGKQRAALTNWQPIVLAQSHKQHELDILFAKYRRTLDVAGIMLSGTDEAERLAAIEDPVERSREVYRIKREKNEAVRAALEGK